MGLKETLKEILDELKIVNNKFNQINQIESNLEKLDGKINRLTGIDGADNLEQEINDIKQELNNLNNTDNILENNIDKLNQIVESNTNEINFIIEELNTNIELEDNQTENNNDFFEIGEETNSIKLPNGIYNSEIDLLDDNQEKIYPNQEIDVNDDSIRFIDNEWIYQYDNGRYVFLDSDGKLDENYTIIIINFEENVYNLKVNEDGIIGNGTFIIQ